MSPSRSIAPAITQIGGAAPSRFSAGSSCEFRRRHGACGEVPNLLVPLQIARQIPHIAHNATSTNGPPASRSWLPVGLYEEPSAGCTGNEARSNLRSNPTNWASIRFFKCCRRIFLFLGLCRLLQCLDHAERDPIEPVDGHGPDDPYAGDANAVPETRPKFRVRGTTFFTPTLQTKRLFFVLLLRMLRSI